MWKKPNWYKNLFKDVDFEYSVTSSGVKENIIVYNPLKYYEFYYTIYASDLNLVSTTEGEIVVYPKTGGSVVLVYWWNPKERRLRKYSFAEQVGERSI